jgi:hypothetical protein
MEVSPDSALRSYFPALKTGSLTRMKPATENRGVVGSIPTLAISCHVPVPGPHVLDVKPVI